MKNTFCVLTRIRLWVCNLKKMVCRNRPMIYIINCTRMLMFMQLIVYNQHNSSLQNAWFNIRKAQIIWFVYKNVFSTLGLGTSSVRSIFVAADDTSSFLYLRHLSRETIFDNGQTILKYQVLLHADKMCHHDLEHVIEKYFGKTLSNSIAFEWHSLFRYGRQADEDSSRLKWHSASCTDETLDHIRQILPKETDSSRKEIHHTCFPSKF
jgi:hypothetical protein